MWKGKEHRAAPPPSTPWGHERKVQMSEEGQLGGRIEGLCQLCCKGEAKYRCPACEKQTCSLSCVNLHKSVGKCSGKRLRAGQAYLPASELTPTVLLDDYWFLEEANNSAKLLAKTIPSPRIRPQMKRLVKTCLARNIHLSLMPAGMNRAKNNKSSTLKGDKIIWTIEWIVLDKTEEHPANLKIDALTPFTRKILYSQCLESDSVIQSYKALFLKDPEYLPNPQAVLLMLRQEADKDLTISSSVDISPNRRLWPLHSPEITWTLLLANRTIIEFPTIYLCHGRTS